MGATFTTLQVSQSRDVPFAYASSRVRMLEQRMLSQSDMERLLSARNIREALHILGDTEYATAMAMARTSDNIDDILAAELQRVYTLVASFAPDAHVLGVWATRHAFHNLKALLKARLQEAPVDDATLSPWTPVASEVLGAAVDRAIQDIEIADSVLASGANKVAAPHLESTLREAAKQAVLAYQRERTPEEIDHVVDVAYQHYVLAVTHQPKTAFLRGWVERLADVTNLRTYIRFALADRLPDSLLRAWLPGGWVPSEQLHQAYQEGANVGERIDALVRLVAHTPYIELVTAGWQMYQKEGLLYGLERLTEQFLADYLRQGDRQPFGIAPVWGYLMAKEREVRAVRFILIGKSAGLSEEQLRERMVHV